jgi:hypothetical protein
MAEFAPLLRTAQPASSRAAPLRSGRRPPQKKKASGPIRARGESRKAAERRKIWAEEALLFFFFTLLIDA